MRTRLLTLFVFYFLCLSCANAEENNSGNHEEGSRFVVIDQRDSAYIVFTGIVKDTDDRKLEEIRLKISKQENVSILTWEQFTASVDRYARSTIVRNDYPNYQVIKGLMCLVGKKPRISWGLTWNGGIAMTFNDYKHVRQSYESYATNPSAYRILDPRLDPVNPGGLLQFFGCVVAEPLPPTGIIEKKPEDEFGYPHKLTGDEISDHFQRHNFFIFDKPPRGGDFTLKIHSFNNIERECTRCNVQTGYGFMTIKASQDQVCFDWDEVSYPSSTCFDVIQVEDNRYQLIDPANNETYGYKVP